MYTKIRKIKIKEKSIEKKNDSNEINWKKFNEKNEKIF